MASLALACSAKDHPPVYVAPEPDGGSAHVQPGQTDAGDGDAQVPDGSGGGGTIPTGSALTVDPDQVYVLAPATADNKWGLSLASAPGAAIIPAPAGFDRFQFRNDTVIHNGPGGGPVYQLASGHDVVVATPPCPADKGASSILTGPNGRFIYNCADGQPWYEDGTQVYGGTERLIALGNSDLAISAGLFAASVVNLTDEQVTALSIQFAPTSILATRAIATGFELAIDYGMNIELFEVNSQGVANDVAAYPALPTNTSALSAGLARDKTLFALTKVGDIFEIYKLTIGGDPELILTDDASSPVSLELALMLNAP